MKRALGWLCFALAAFLASPTVVAAADAWWWVLFSQTLTGTQLDITRFLRALSLVAPAIFVALFGSELLRKAQ